MSKVLIADVGGTNIRFGLAEDKKVTHVSKFRCADFKSTEEAIQTYLNQVGEKPDYFVAGAAGEINEDGRIELTNSALQLDIRDISQKFGFKKGLLANDVVFHTVKVLDLPSTDWEELNPNTTASQKNPSSCVIVVGTGFGGSYANDGCVEASEPGHHEAIPSRRGGKTDENVWGFMREQREGIWEDYVSGPSSLRIYQYLTAIRTDRDKLATTPREVTELAHKGDEAAVTTYKIMARFLAQFLGQEVPDRHLSNIYLGGLTREILSLPDVRQEFLDALYDRPGKYASKHARRASIRLIKTDENLAMEGLAMVADDIVRTGTTKRILKRDLRLFDREKEEKKKSLEMHRALTLSKKINGGNGL
jgi:glucokinase